METQLANPAMLALLLLVPALGALRLWPALRRRRAGVFVFSRARLAASRGRTWRVWLDPLPDVLALLALGLLIVAMARPQRLQAQEVEVEGIDIYLALDMSGSMRAIDMSREEIAQLERRGKRPQDRFEIAIDTLKTFVRSRRADRIGMVVFGSEAYLQFPLTLDYNTILGMLDRLRLGDINQGGTAIGNAAGRAVAGLKDSDATTKILILITDGDRRGGNISPRQAAEMAKTLGVKIFPILVGKEGLTLMPVGRDMFSGQTSYQEREFPINPPLLQEMAQLTGGEYLRAVDRQALEEGLHQILDKFERAKLEDATHVEVEERYHPWLAWAIVLLIGQLALRHTVLRRYP